MYFYEGESELAILNALKRKGHIPSSRTYKMCLSTINSTNFERKIKVLFNPSKMPKMIYLIVDCDVFRSGNCLETFKGNLQILRKHVKNVTLILQWSLEHELCHSLGLKERDLYGRFDSSSANEFKSNLCNCKPDSLLKKLPLESNRSFWCSNHHKMNRDELSGLSLFVGCIPRAHLSNT